MNSNDVTNATASDGDLAAMHGLVVAQDALRAWPAVAAILLGGLIVLGVGFGPGIAHNAAHDTRHALVFPCH